MPRIITQASSEEPERLFWTNLRPDTPPPFPSLFDIPTVPNSPEISNSNNPFSKFELVASKKKGSMTYKGRLADLPNLVQPQPRNPFKQIFIPLNDSGKVAETVLDRLECQHLDNSATADLLHNPRIHPTTEISNIPVPTSPSSSPERMFKQTGEITPPGSKAREWVQLLEQPIAKELKRLDFKSRKKGKLNPKSGTLCGPRELYDMS